MKTEFVVFSPLGVFALILSGYLFAQGDAPMVLFGILNLLVAREDAKGSFVSGSYKRNWLVWRRVGDVSEGGAGNVVPFRGPAA